MLTAQQVKNIFDSISSCEDLNKENIIDRIKEQLKLQNQTAYEKWKRNGFDVGYVFGHPNFPFRERKTLLHLAAENGEVEAIHALIDRGAKVDKKGSKGNTPLHLAARCGHAKAVDALIVKWAKVDAKNDDGNTPLHWAAECGKVEAIAVLIDKGAKVDEKNDYGNTPLHSAAIFGEAKAINALIAKGAVVNEENHEGNTPLHFAARNHFFINDSVKAVNALIDGGADPLLKNKYGKTPEDLVKNNRNLKKFLKEAELFSAVKKGDIEKVKELLEKGTNVKAVDSHGKTLFNYATNENVRDVLIAAGNKQAAKKGFVAVGVVTGSGAALATGVFLAGLVTISQSSIVTAALAVAAAAIIAGGVTYGMCKPNTKLSDAEAHNNIKQPNLP